jgi:carbon storage regulator
LGQKLFWRLRESLKQILKASVGLSLRELAVAAKENFMLVLTRKVGEKLIVGNSVVVEVLKAQGGRVRIGIEAPHEIPVYREEIRDRFAGAKPTAKLKPQPQRSRFFPEFA